MSGKRKQAEGLREATPRMVVSVHMPTGDYVTAQRAAGISGESLAEFIREAVRRRAGRVLKAAA